MSERDTCALCELEGHDDIQSAIVEWKDPIGRDRFETVDRCTDRIACRIRLEAQVDEATGRHRTWPIVDLRRDLEAWEKRAGDDVPPPPPPPAERPTVAAIPPPDREVEAPPTWSPSFVDEPEEERSWI